MAKFKSRPEFIEAVQFTGNNLDEIVAFTGESFVRYGGNIDLYGDVYFVLGHKGMSWILFVNGDWIIKEKSGFFNPMQDDVFKEKYEPAPVVNLNYPPGVR